jgi:hypothetical protein
MQRKPPVGRPLELAARRRRPHQLLAAGAFAGAGPIGTPRDAFGAALIPGDDRALDGRLSRESCG